MDMHKPTIINHGLFAEHDMSCAVCCSKKAVFNCNKLIFEPCWECQNNKWALIRVPKFLINFLKKR